MKGNGLKKEEMNDIKSKILDLKRKRAFDDAMFEVGKLIEDIKFQTDQDSRILIGWLLHQMGSIYEKTGTGWEEARKWYNTAFVYRITFDPIGAAEAIFQISMLEKKLVLNSDLEEEDFLPYFLKAKSYVENAVYVLQGKILKSDASIEEKEKYGSMLYKLAYIQQLEGNKEKAKFNYQTALDFADMVKDTRTKALALIGLAQTEDDKKAAEKYLEEAQKLFVSIGDADNLKLIRDIREEIQKKNNNKV